MQIGSVNSPFTPRSLADAWQKPDEKQTPATNAEAQQPDENAVGKKDPIAILKEQLAKESEPSAFEKFQLDFAKKALESFSQIAQAWRNTSNENKSSLLDLSNKIGDSQSSTQDSDEAAKAKEEEEKKAADTLKPTSTSANKGLTIEDFNLVPLASFQSSSTASYTASYDSKTGQAVQELAYSNTYNFVFKGSVTDQNGKTFNIEANITLTHSLYSRVTGGADSLDPKVLQQIQNGNPLQLDYEGDGSDLANQPIALFLDNLGASNQITNDPVFGDLAKTGLGKGLGSLLEGLRIFKDDLIANALGTNSNGANTNATNANNALLDDSDKNPFKDWKPNLRNLLGLGEQGTGIVWFSQMQTLLYAQTHDDNGTMLYGASFSYQSVSYSKNQSVLDLLEQQKNQQDHQNISGTEVKKALDAYSNTTDTTNTAQSNGLLQI